MENNYHRLENIEDIEEFSSAISRHNLTRKLSAERPYTYWTIELYDMENGIRGGGGLGVLAADTRRVAENVGAPFVLITPFYPSESHQVFEKAEKTPSDATTISFPDTIPDHKNLPFSETIKSHTTHINKDYHDFGFNFIDSVFIKCDGNLCRLDVIEKVMGTTRLLCITEPGFGELYQGTSGGDHRLYQEVSLGFGGYQALKLIGKKPSVIQLNEVATFFAALARLDELASSGMDFYEAVVYTRKHTLYTNHTLIQAAEAEFHRTQFERFVYPNLRSRAVKKWLSDKFVHDKIRLSNVAVEIAELKSGVSKLHARVANYHDLSGEKVHFDAVTNGIDPEKWLLPSILAYYRQLGVFGRFDLPGRHLENSIDSIDASHIRSLKSAGRELLNSTLSHRPDQYGRFLHFSDSELIFDFKRRFVDYKRPTLPFTDLDRFKSILESHDAHYIFTGRVHEGDANMYSKLTHLLNLIDRDPFLRTRVHYLPDYDEELALALSAGSNISINVPIVGLEACGTSWEKDIGNLCLLISTHDGGVADCPSDSYLNVSGQTEAEEVSALYERMEEAASAWEHDFDLEYWTRKQLKAYVPVISGSRMLRDYLELLFG